MGHVGIAVTCAQRRAAATPQQREKGGGAAKGGVEAGSCPRGQTPVTVLRRRTLSCL